MFTLSFAVVFALVLGGVLWMPLVIITIGLGLPHSWVLPTTLLFSGWHVARNLRRNLHQGYPHEAATLLVETRAPTTDGERAAARTLRRLCRQADVSAPAFRVKETSARLCLTVAYPSEQHPATVLEEGTGSDPGALADTMYAVVVSTGTLAALSERELTAVLAHEVAHRSNADLRLMNAVLAPVYSLDHAGSPGLNPRSPTTFVLSLVVVLARGREFAADYGSARLTGDPVGLATALMTLGGVDNRPTVDLRAVHSVNVSPVDAGPGVLRYAHPPTTKRIDRLRSVD